MDHLLPSPTRLAPPRTAAAWARLRAALGAAWRHLTMGADERWLRQAGDLVDLELRLKALERNGLACDAWPVGPWR